MILKQCLLVLLAMFLVMGCVGAVSADGELKINSFSADPLKVNVNSPVTFTFDVENYTTISIAFGDGGNPYTPTESGSITHPYSTAKTYTATLTATNATTSVTLSRYIEATEPVIPLAASFTTDKSSGVAPLTVKFTDTSTGPPGEYTYTWTFGSAGNSTEKDPTFTFNAPGTYQVKLNVSTDTAYSVSTPQTITVTPRVITDVGIFGLDAPVSGQSPDYSASISSTPNGNVNSTPVVSWYTSNGTPFIGNFANGTVYKAIVTIEAINDYNFTSTTGFVVDDFSTSSVSHVLESNNRFVNVTCTYPATDAGTRDISSVSITGVTLPVGGATKNTTKPAVSSNPSGSVDTISSITWKNWSDESTDGTIFKYETVYKAIMTVEAKSGYRFTSGSAATLNGNDAYLVPSTDGKSATITYTCTKTAAEGKILPAITKFTVTPTYGTSPLTVRFTVATTNATTVTLNFGDGSTPSSTKNGYVDHTYSSTATHYAILTATNTNSSVTQTLSILVNTPVATSTPTATQTAEPTNTLFTPISIGNVSIPAPLDVIKEFMHLFYSLFDSTNYVFIVNES